jgi:dCTP deaminase
MLADYEIKQLSIEKKMIEPFDEKSVGKVISYGLSSYGYDYRISDEFFIPNPDYKGVIDPKNISPELFTTIKQKTVEIAPNSYLLAKSYEYFRIPRDILIISFGKSTLARAGVIVNVTPLEPEWEGYLTISIGNLSPYPVKLYPFEGIGQLVFLRAENLCKTSYKDKKGKYQAQKKITVSKVNNEK